MALTPKQQRFCEEYLVDLNGTQAAIRAGYSPDTATAIASENLTKLEVSEYLTRLRSERSAATKIDAAWLLKRLADEAVADIADLYTADGALKSVHEWPEVWRTGLVQGIEAEEIAAGRGDGREVMGIMRKVKLSDRVKRLELIGKHIGVQAFKDQVAVSGVINVTISEDDSKL